MGASGSAASPDASELKAGPSPVILHIYDVGVSNEVRLCNRLLRTLGTGIFHCGVEVHDGEWGFEAKGIFQCRPQQCRGHNYVESIPMGKTLLSQSQVLKLITMLTKEWQGKSYDLLKHNCCHFANEFCHWLGVDTVPNWVTNLAGAGAMVADTGSNLEAVCCEPMDCKGSTFLEAASKGESSWPESLALGFCGLGGLCSSTDANIMREMQAMGKAPHLSPKGWQRPQRPTQVAPPSRARSGEQQARGRETQDRSSRRPPEAAPSVVCGCIGGEAPGTPAASKRVLTVDQNGGLWMAMAAGGDDTAQVDLDPMEVGHHSYALALGRMAVPQAVQHQPGVAAPRWQQLSLEEALRNRL